MNVLKKADWKGLSYSHRKVGEVKTALVNELYNLRVTNVDQ